MLCREEDPGLTEEMFNAVLKEDSQLPWLAGDKEHMADWYERTGRKPTLLDRASGAVMRDAYLLGIVTTIVTTFLKLGMVDVELLQQPGASLLLLELCWIPKQLVPRFLGC